MKVLIQVEVLEGMSEDKIREILAKEDVLVEKIETLEKFLNPSCEGWDN